MNPSVSILMGFNCKCKCYLFTHEHSAGAHTFHVELEFRIVGKMEVSRKKNLSEQRREPAQQTQPTLGFQLWYT